MALITYVRDELYQEALGSPQVANLLRAIFNAPAWATAFVHLAGVQMTALALPPADRELVILHAGYLLDSDYVVAQHVDIAVVAGLSEGHLAAVRQQRFRDAIFSDRQQALLHFVQSLATRAYPNDRALRDAKRYFTDRELVEIVGVHGFAAIVASITKTFGIEVDHVRGEDLPRFSRQLDTRESAQRLPDRSRDELDILRLLARLAQAGDDRDEEAYLACLADKVQDATAGEVQVPAADYTKASIARVSRADWTHHQLFNPIIEIDADGDRASGLVDVVVDLAFTDGGGQQQRAAIHGRYDLGFVRSDGAWRVDRRALHQRHVDGELGGEP